MNPEPETDEGRRDERQNHGRVTDHRIGYTQHNLPAIMNGEIDDFIEQLRMADSAERMTEAAK